jgi:monoamine oxidase
MKRPSVAIIGGGPGGLMAAYLLEKRARFPCAITLFEASNRVGGKIVTRRFDAAPVLYEAGAAELYGYGHIGPDPLRELVEELGLPTSPMQGQTVVLGDRVLTTADDVEREFGAPTARALRHFNRRARSLISPAEYYESDWQIDNEDPLSNHSFRALLDRVEDGVARRYIEVAVHSDLATEPHQTSAMYGLQNYLINEPEYMRLYTIDGGIERLPQELARRLAARVLLNRRAVRVERTPEGRYRVVTRHHGETRADEFDFVVVALPNNWVPAVEWGGATLAAAMRRHHNFYDYPAHYLRVSVLFERPFWRDRIAESYFMLDAFGGCCVYDESSRNGGHDFGVLGWLLGGEAALTMSNFEDGELVGQMLDTLPRCLRHGRQAVLEGRVHRWVGSVNGLPGGRPAREPDSRHQPEPTEHPRLFVVGDYLFDSTINGLLDSADVVVEWILEEVAEARAVPANGPRAGEAAPHGKNGKLLVPAPAPPVPLPRPPYPVEQGRAS